jgi:hypothetical protein
MFSSKWRSHGKQGPKCQRDYTPTNNVMREKKRRIKAFWGVGGKRVVGFEGIQGWVVALSRQREDRALQVRLFALGDGS